jgi:3D (Asp-Asp-Asp) domain-containing protein
MVLTVIMSLAFHAPPRPRPAKGVSLALVATAYCVRGRTRSGVRTHHGVVAADPKVLPVGTRIRIEGLGPRHNGVYTVMDTGAAVKGREIDIFMADCARAKRFGRQRARVQVLNRARPRARRTRTVRRLNPRFA